MDDKSKSSYHSHNKSHVVPKQELSSIMTQEIPYILKSKSSQYLTDEQDEDIKNPIKILEHLHHTINNKMQQLDKLNGQYFANQQKLFFKTFINIMDRMSNQLAQVKQKYQNIDQEINNQKQCVEMRSKLCFYRDQSLIMKKQLESIEKQLKKIRQNNVFKQNQNRILLSKLTKQVKKQQKYRHRKYSLETKLEDFDLSLLGLKRTAKNSTKNRCPSAFSSQHFNIQFQEHKKPINKQKRPMTAIQMQGQCKTLDKNVLILEWVGTQRGQRTVQTLITQNTHYGQVGKGQGREKVKFDGRIIQVILEILNGVFNKKKKNSHQFD